MNLLRRIITNTAVSLIVIIALWMSCTYLVSVHEIYDEIDDTLESYADRFIERADEVLLNDSMIVSANIGNGIHIERVSPEYGRANTGRRFYNREIYIDEIREDQDSRFISFTYKSTSGQWYEVSMFTPSFDQKDFGEILMNSSIILGAVLIAAIISIISFILYRSMKPMYNILDKLNRHKPGQDIDFGNTSGEITEFRKIREAISASIVKYNEAYNQQKMFIGNASHEIQTPLAVCHNTIEMLIEDPDIRPDQIELLARIDDRLGYISKLNKTLLILTKLENSQFEETCPVNLSTLASDTAREMSELYDWKNITLDMENISSEGFVTDINPTLAKSLIGNLLKNAYVHTPDGGMIRIDSDSSGISICNSSEKELDSRKIFTYFYKGPDSPPSSTGLGLPMAAAICKRYGLALEYKFGENMNIFRIFRNNSVSARNFVSH